LNPTAVVQVNSDDRIDLQASAPTYALEAETHAIVGFAFDVLNEHGHGLNEKCYENSLVVEFKLRGIAFDQQRRYEVLYKGQHVGEFTPDLIAYGKVVVDTKTIERITDHERGKMMNYLKVTKLPVGLILNFKHPRLQWERVVLSQNLNQPQMNDDGRP
jgi:GxxExxY protein